MKAVGGVAMREHSLQLALQSIFQARRDRVGAKLRVGVDEFLG
jgi:hypothetical protein